MLNDDKVGMSVKTELIIKANTTHIKFYGVRHWLQVSLSILLSTGYPLYFPSSFAIAHYVVKKSLYCKQQKWNAIKTFHSEKTLFNNHWDIITKVYSR